MERDRQDAMAMMNKAPNRKVALPMEQDRIHVGDSLYWLYQDLLRSARNVRSDPGPWIEAVAFLLAQVPNEDQRIAWAILLTAEIATPTRPIHVLVPHVLGRSVLYAK